MKDATVLLAGFVAGMAVTAGGLVLALWVSYRMDVVDDRERSRRR